jgi:hypothetical protein
LPPDLDTVRQKLFDLKTPLLLNSQQIADYWYYMTNIFVRDIAPSTQTNGIVVEVWECRNCRRVNRMHKEEGTAKRKRTAKRHLLETEESCKFQFRVLYYIKHADTDEDHATGLGNCWCLPEWIHLERTARSEDHNHTRSQPIRSSVQTA